MQKTVVALSLIFSALFAQAQDVSELDKRNGFKDIKLTMPVDSVKGATLKKEFEIAGNVYPSKLYEVEHPDYEQIGDIKVHGIELKTYRDVIYEISIITEKDPRLMKAMENVFGQASYDSKNHLYFWKTESVVLTYTSHSKKELELVYKSITVPKMMKKDKEKKIDTISDDF